METPWLNKFARLLAAVAISLPIAILAGAIGKFFWTPGWMVVAYIVPARNMKDMGRSLTIGFGLDFVLICAVLYWTFGWIQTQWRNR
jgi:hypothetical protein